MVLVVVLVLVLMVVLVVVTVAALVLEFVHEGSKKHGAPNRKNIMPPLHAQTSKSQPFKCPENAVSTYDICIQRSW